MPFSATVVLCALGCGFLIPAMIFQLLKRKYKKDCTKDTTAVVIAVHVWNSGDNATLHPEYEYFVDGKRYSNTGGHRHRWHVPKKGTEVQIRYNPDRPQQSYIVNYDLLAYNRQSIIFGIFGLIPIAICVIIKMSSFL